MSLKYEFDGADGKKHNNEKPDEQQETEYFHGSGHIRNITFVQSDGESEFFNYAYLVKGRYSPKDSTVVITFTTHEVTIKGYKLAKLFNEIRRQQVEQIVAVEKRHASEGEDKFQIIQIIISQL